MSRYLDKVSKLLAQAENAGTPEEAATFMEKAQAMARANAIDLAVARQHQAKKERVQFPEERRIQINPHSRRHNRKHFMELAMHVADVNDVKYLISGGEYALLAVGFPSDLDVVEALFTSLALQMVAECDAALARGDNTETRKVIKQKRVELADEERAWGEHIRDSYFYAYDADETWMPQPPRFGLRDVTDEFGNPVYEEKRVSLVDGRVFRHEFYSAFTRRINARLWDARRTADKDAGVEDTSGTGLALRDKEAEVTKADEERRAKVKHLGVYHGVEDDDRHYDDTGRGRVAGQRAAENAVVGGAREIGKRTKELGS